MTDISKPDIYDIPLSEIDEITARYITLRNQGHAITMDHTFNSSARLEIIRIHHYRSCVACGEAQRGKAL
jgi:hypothetical protein